MAIYIFSVLLFSRYKDQNGTNHPNIFIPLIIFS